MHMSAGAICYPSVTGGIQVVIDKFHRAQTRKLRFFFASEFYYFASFFAENLELRSQLYRIALFPHKKLTGISRPLGIEAATGHLLRLHELVKLTQIQEKISILEVVIIQYIRCMRVWHFEKEKCGKRFISSIIRARHYLSLFSETKIS